MFHLVFHSACCKFWRFLRSCFHNDRYNLDILYSLNRVARKKISMETLLEAKKYVHSAVLAYFSCHPVVRLQWCWQLIHVLMSGLPGWQSGYIKLTFPLWEWQDAVSQDNKAVTNSCLRWQLSDLFIDNDQAEPLHEKHHLTVEDVPAVRQDGQLG